MKRFISIVLVLSMILSMGITANAATKIQTEIFGAGAYSYRMWTSDFDTDQKAGAAIALGTDVTGAFTSYHRTSPDYAYTVAYGTDPSSTIKVASDPKKSGNQVLDVNSKTANSGLSANQLATFTGWWHKANHSHLIHMDLMFTGNDKYQIVVGGIGANASGSSWTANVVNVEFAVGNNASGAGFYANGTKVGTMVPKVNEWFDFKIIINNITGYYDIYADNVKINSESIRNVTGFSTLLTSSNNVYRTLSLGACKDYGSDGHMYIDNMGMANMASESQVMNYENLAFTIPSGVTTGDVLPTITDVYANAVTWTSDNTNVTVDSNGKVYVPLTEDGKQATFTASIAIGSVTTTKDFTVILNSYDKQVKIPTIYGNYASNSAAYTFEGNTIGDSVTEAHKYAAYAGNSGAYGMSSLAYTSDNGNTATIQADPVNASNKVIDIYSAHPENKLVTTGTWQHTDVYHIFEMDLYFTGNDRYAFEAYNQGGTAAKIEFGIGNNSGGAGFYANGIKVGKDEVPAGEWFNFRIIVDGNAKTSDIFVNGRKINSAPIASAYGTYTTFKFGAVNGYGSGGHMYIDNLYMSRANANQAANYESAVMQFAKYVSNGDVLTTKTDVFKLGVAWTCDNGNVTIASNGVVSIPESEDGKTATFTATLPNGTTKQFAATLNGYALNTKYIEDFEYHWLNGKSISERSDWVVVDENRDPATTHSITSVVKTSENPYDAALAVQIYGKDGSVAQLAKHTPNANLSSDYAVLSADLKLSDVANQYVIYVQGELENTSTGSKTIVNLAQLTFTGSNGVIGALENTKVSGSLFTSGDNAFPRNQWFRLDVVFNNANQTYDIYSDGVKVNTQPIKLYGYSSGFSVASITQVQYGVPRYYWRAATYYADDISMLSFDGRAAAGYDARKVTVGANTADGATLPVSGEYFGSTISWASSNSGVLSVASDGKVTVAMPDSDTQITLTATITNKEKSVTKTFTTLVLSDTGRLNDLVSTLTGYKFTGQKYIVNNFTANVPGKNDTDVITVSSSDTSVISFDGLNATVTPKDEDKYVDVTVTVTSSSGKTATKVLKLYVLSDSRILAYDGFNYSDYINSSIAGRGLWSVESENLDTASTGSTHILKANPDDATDTMVDVEIFRTYSYNQLMKYDNSVKLPHKSIMQMNMKFPDTAGNRYLLYIQGTYLTESGSTTSSAVSQFYIWRNDGTITCEGVKDGSGNYINIMPNGALPTNQWFNFKVEFDNLNRTFDLYIDNVKQNANPVPFYRNVTGDKLISIDTVRFGISRYSGNPGHVYVDDLMFRAQTKDAVQYELDNLAIPSTFVNDVNLPVDSNIFTDTIITWASSNEGIVTNNGNLITNYGFGSREVTLTATANLEGKVATRTFDIKAINTPYFTIDNVVFTDGANDTYTPVSGGTIKNVSVTKYDPAAYNNAKVVVAVYDKDSLVAVSQPMAVTQTATINLGTQIPQNGENLYAKAFVWNMDTMAPLSYEFRTANELDSKIDIFSIGDSTMQSYGNLSDRQNANDMTGWMQVMPLGMDDDYVNVNNHGRSGKSTRSFTEQGWINPVWENIGEGDYFIIQFGHNDQKPWVDQDALVNYAPLEEQHFIDGLTLEVPEQFANYKTYEQWLREYVAAARKKGAYPVFATSIRRRQFDESGNVKNSHAGYPEAMIEVAKELNVPVIDLHSKTETWINNHGVDDSLQFFCASYNGSDNTHLTYKGAVGVANIAIDAMKEIGLPIAQYATEIR